MKYFKNITDLEQAKLRYRNIAKQLHPDKGGSITEFQQMQQEYKALLVGFHNGQSLINSQTVKQTDIMDELRKLAKVLIEKQVPQEYLKQKIENSQSAIERTIFSDIISFLDKL